jgi:hypothetical protein
MLTSNLEPRTSKTSNGGTSWPSQFERRNLAIFCISKFELGSPRARHHPDRLGLLYRAVDDADEDDDAEVDVVPAIDGRTHLAPTTASCWFGFRNLDERRSERMETLLRGEEVESWAGCMVTATLRQAVNIVRSCWLLRGA